MRKVSNFNMDSMAKGNIVTTIVGNRRISMMNNVVISSEAFVPEQPTPPSLKT
jgi:hypothetical protein